MKKIGDGLVIVGALIAGVLAFGTLCIVLVKIVADALESHDPMIIGLAVLAISVAMVCIGEVINTFQKEN